MKIKNRKLSAASCDSIANPIFLLTDQRHDIVRRQDSKENNSRLDFSRGARLVLERKQRGLYMEVESRRDAKERTRRKSIDSNTVLTRELELGAAAHEISVIMYWH